MIVKTPGSQMGSPAAAEEGPLCGNEKRMKSAVQRPEFANLFILGPTYFP